MKQVVKKYKKFQKFKSKNPKNIQNLKRILEKKIFCDFSEKNYFLSLRNFGSAGFTGTPVVSLLGFRFSSPLGGVYRVLKFL